MLSEVAGGVAAREAVTVQVVSQRQLSRSQRVRTRLRVAEEDVVAEQVLTRMSRFTHSAYVLSRRVLHT